MEILLVQSIDCIVDYISSHTKKAFQWTSTDLMKRQNNCVRQKEAKSLKLLNKAAEKDKNAKCFSRATGDVYDANKNIV